MSRRAGFSELVVLCLDAQCVRETCTAAQAVEAPAVLAPTRLLLSNTEEHEKQQQQQQQQQKKKKGGALEGAVARGFGFHHAEQGYVMLTRWLPTDCPSPLPANASTQVGVGVNTQAIDRFRSWHEIHDLIWVLR